MDLRRFLMQSHDLSEKGDAVQFASHWTPVLIKKGMHIVHQGEPEANEFIILEGGAASRIYDQNGAAVCVGLHIGASVVTPNIARTRNGDSLVSIEALTDTLVAKMDSNVLTEAMIASETVREWANGILREELARKADREWCLAALGGSARLAWFRERYPEYEEIFTHSLIASFIGVSPVTLSRLRNAD